MGRKQILNIYRARQCNVEENTDSSHFFCLFLCLHSIYINKISRRKKTITRLGRREDQTSRRFIFAIEHKLGFLFPGKDSPFFDLCIPAAEWWLSPIFFQVLILLREFWRKLLRFQMGKFCCFPSSSEVPIFNF